MGMNATQKKIKEERKNSSLTIINTQGCEMKCVEYNTNHDIIVEFQDKYKSRVHTEWKHFIEGKTKNPYSPSVLGVGIIGNKYPITSNGKRTKEYSTWYSIILRTHRNDFQERCPTYKNVSVCNEWLLYDNFYEWLHSQENFEKWLNGERWEVDKDIVHKGNKVYSPENCCLVPHNINCIILKKEFSRGDLPIGVSYHIKSNRYEANCNNPYAFGTTKSQYLGRFSNPTDAFNAYKNFKEQIIKRMAQEEYDKGNIVKRCYDAMMNYEVEITD